MESERRWSIAHEYVPVLLADRLCERAIAVGDEETLDEWLSSGDPVTDREFGLFEALRVADSDGLLIDKESLNVSDVELEPLP